MFKQARIKLTAWYLAIIMFVSFSFSAVLYHMLSREVERFEKMHRVRIEEGIREGRLPGGIVFRQPLYSVQVLDPELVEDIKHRIVLILVTINGGIFIVAGGLSYFLAGKTLQPIKVMVDEQQRFISDASHELRTPLTSLKCAMEVFLRGNRQTLKEARQIIQDNIGEVDKLQKLTSSLLTLAHFNQPNGKMEMKRFPIKAVIQRSVKQLEPIAKSKEISITQNGVDATVIGNKDEVEQLFIILLDNAIKYSPPKNTVLISSEKSNKSIRISVTDYGIGLHKKDIPHVFDRFFRADTARGKNEVGGFGLGLAIAKKIVTIHKGSITVESNGKKGTTFSVRLPLAKEDLLTEEKK